MFNASIAARSLWLYCLASFILSTSLAAQSKVQQSTAANLFPKSTLVYAEVPNPKQLLELILNHPLRKKIEQLPAYRKALRSPEFLPLQLGVGLFEGHMGMPWNEALEAISDGGVYFGFDAKTQGSVLLIKARNLDTLINLRKTVFQIVQGGAQTTGKPDPIKKGEYRGLTAYEINNVKFMALDSWLLLTNKNELGKRIIDQHLDGGSDQLANHERFTSAVASKVNSSAAWAFTDVTAIRHSGALKELYSGQTDNILAEVLLGGLLGNLKHTPYGTASLSASEAQLKLALQTPHTKQMIGEREFFFGPDNSGRAPAPLQANDNIFTLGTYRDLSQMWLRAGDLMTDKANDQLAQADSQLTTFFSGKDFGEDILGSLHPELQLVVTRQRSDDYVVQPAIRLPAFALIARMRQPEATQPQFRRVFQSFVGFINVVGAMNAQPQLDLNMESNAHGQLISAAYVREASDKDTQAKINFNFSPSLAFANDRMVLSSSKQLATELAQIDPKSVAQEVASQPAPNTLGQLNVANLRQVLEDNRGQIVAQNMLEKGHSKEAAEGEVEVLMLLLDLFQSGDITLSTTAGELRLESSLQFNK